MAGTLRLSNTGTGNGQSTITTAASGDTTYTLPSGGGTFVTTGSTQALTVAFASGTVSAPSITFLGNSNTGIYSPAADTIAFTEGGVEALRIDSSGQVGIGTSSASTNVEINAALDTGVSLGLNEGQLSIGREANSGGAVRIGYDTTNNFGFISSGRVGTSWDRLILNAGGGNVGIGTTSPQETLHLSGTGWVRTQYGSTISSTAYNAYLGIQGNNYGAMAAGDMSVLTGTSGQNIVLMADSATGTIRFASGGSTERARIDSSGRLLVGTSSSRSWSGIDSQIQIESTSLTSQSIINNSASVTPGLLALGKSRGTSVGSNTVVQNGDTLGNIVFLGADGSALKEAAYVRAEVDGTPGANDMPGRLIFSTTADGASSPTERMRIDSSGRLLVGTTSALGPSTTSTGITFFPGDYSVMSSAGNEPLTLNRNNDGAILSCRRSGTNVGSISVTTTATAFNTSSDYRLKENVVDLDGAVDRLKQLPVCRFNFIADPDKTVDGFIAHEVQAVVPEAVTGAKDEVDADGNPIYQGIDQSKLVPLLTAALQEAIGRIEALEAEVAALKAQ